jgi:hypothetical protein
VRHRVVRRALGLALDLVAVRTHAAI